jgi:xanthine dehydrogenase YagT iron-sulfur-binding subunit
MGDNGIGGVLLPNDRKPPSATDVPEEQKNETAEQQLPYRLSRRSFLSHLGAAGLAATAPPVFAATTTPDAPAADHVTEAAADKVPLTLTVNGKSHRLQLDPRTTLLDCLRENLNMPGTNRRHRPA